MFTVMAVKPQAKSSNIGRRIRAVRLPPSLKKQFRESFGKWVEESGKDWAVSRVKAYRDCILKSYSEGHLTGKPQWVSTTCRGNLKGWYGQLYKIAMSSARNLKAVIHLLQLYTTEMHTPGEVDLDGIIHSIAGQSPVPQVGSQVRRVYPALQRLGLFKNLRVGPPTPLLQVLPHDGQVSRLPWELEQAFEGAFWPVHEDLLVRALGKNPYSRYAHNWRVGQLLDNADQYESWLNGGATYQPYTDFWLQSGAIPHIKMIGNTREDMVAGSIGIHCQPGNKDRYYFAPNLVYQRALDPLKEGLARIVQSLPWDCTYDQRKADKVVRRALQEHRKVFSVDLHAATDNFPWWFQKVVLEGIIDKRRYVKGELNFAPACRNLLVDLIERGSIVFESGNGFTIFPGFSKGQPLGMGPSFFLFTLSHGLLLYILNGMKWDHDFFVVGDDVIIFDERLHRKYRNVLIKWNVEASELKSFSSDRLASFAGMTYTAHLQWWSPKWYTPTSDNVLDLCRYWPDLSQGFKDKKSILRVLALPEPYGIGYNPEGKPLSERCPENLSALLADRLLAADDNILRESSTTIGVRKLTVALTRNNSNIDEEYLWALLSCLETDPRVLPMFSAGLTTDRMLLDALEGSPYEVPLRCMSGIESALSEIALRDGTDVPGFPSWHVSKSKDPRNLGPLRSWLRTFSEADHPEAKVTFVPKAERLYPWNKTKSKAGSSAVTKA